MWRRPQSHKLVHGRPQLHRDWARPGHIHAGQVVIFTFPLANHSFRDGVVSLAGRNTDTLSFAPYAALTTVSTLSTRHLKHLKYPECPQVPGSLQ